MALQTFCNNCIQEHSCRSIYEKMGDASGAPVTLKVILAFLLPLIVFIISLAVFEKVFTDAIYSERVRTAVGFLLAFLVALTCIIIIRVIRKYFK